MSGDEEAMSEGGEAMSLDAVRSVADAVLV